MTKRCPLCGTVWSGVYAQGRFWGFRVVSLAAPPCDFCAQLLDPWPEGKNAHTG